VHAMSELSVSSQALARDGDHHGVGAGGTRVLMSAHLTRVKCALTDVAIDRVPVFELRSPRAASRNRGPTRFLARSSMAVYTVAGSSPLPNKGLIWMNSVPTFTRPPPNVAAVQRMSAVVSGSSKLGRSHLSTVPACVVPAGPTTVLQARAAAAARRQTL
jgi:hypothetical protein